MKKKLCVSCGKAPFKPRPQTPHQSYCSEPACQRTRRRNWQNEKRTTDADYKDNQARAQWAGDQAWLLVDRLAKALSIDPRTSTLKATLLDGICPKLPNC